MNDAHTTLPRCLGALSLMKLQSAIGLSRASNNYGKNGKHDLTISDLKKLSACPNVSIAVLLDHQCNNAKFKQMHFYVPHCFKDGIPKTKLAKILYLADFSFFYDNLFPMLSLGVNGLPTEAVWITTAYVKEHYSLR